MHLQANPPVDMEQVRALSDLIDQALEDGVSLTGTSGELERFLVARGVRVVVPEEDK